MHIEAACLPRDATRLPERVALDDSAQIALRLYRSAVSDPLRPTADKIGLAFGETGAAQGLARLGLAEDVTFCAQIDMSEVVPRLARPGEATPYPLSIVATG